MLPSASDAAHDLLAKVEALRQAYEAGTVIPFGRARAREKLFAAADRLKAEFAKPVREVIAPYSPWKDWVGQ